MKELTITCPSCSTEIPLNETLAHSVLEKERAALRDGERQLVRKVESLAAEKAALEAQRLTFDQAITEAVAERLDVERRAAAEQATINARDVVAAEIQEKDLRIAALLTANKEHQERLAAVQAAELSLERERAKLEEKSVDLALTVQREVNKRMQEVRESARVKAEERFVVDIQERDLQIEQLRCDIEALRKKADQGSQQLQGTAQELTVEQALRTAFPSDVVTAIKKGEPGGDVIQQVTTPEGRSCDSILVESKRTKNWNGEWIAKLRSDQQDARAAHAVLVTNALPRGVTSFGFVEGVWVVTPAFFIPVISMLRHGIIEVSSARIASKDRQTKAEHVYEYLVRGNFAHRVNALADAIHALRSDFHLRRKRAQRELATEEQRINAAEAAMMRLVGDFQGIAGERLALEDVESLALSPGEPDRDPELPIARSA